MPATAIPFYQGEKVGRNTKVEGDVHKVKSAEEYITTEQMQAKTILNLVGER